MIPSNWYEDPDYPKVLVAVIEYYTTTAKKLYCSTAPLLATLDGQLTTFNPRLLGDISFSVGLVDSDKGSRTTSNYGKLKFMNGDGQLDYWLDYGFDGRDLDIYVAPEGVTDITSQGVKVFTGKVDKLEVEDNTSLSLVFKDPLLELDTPIQPVNYTVGEVITYYDGFTTKNVTVTDNLKEKTKPMVYGQVYNIEPVLISAANKVYQVDFVPIEGVTAVYDRGIKLTPGVGYRLDNDKGIIELMFNNAGTITCDVKGRKLSGTYSAKLSDIISDILKGKGYAPVVYNNVPVKASNVGIYLTERENTLDVLDKLVASTDSFYGFSPSGSFLLGNLSVLNTFTPSYIDAENFSKYGDVFTDRGADTYVLGSDIVGTPDFSSVETLSESCILTPVPFITTITESDILGEYSLAVVNDVVYKSKVRYSKNYTVQTDVASATIDADREFMSKEYRETTAEDLTIQTKHKRAIESILEDSLLVDATDATLLANRMLVKNAMPILEVKLRVSSYKVNRCTLGSAIRLFDYRYGFGRGVLGTIREIGTDYLANVSTLTFICTRVPNQFGTFNYGLTDTISLPAETVTTIDAYHNTGRKLFSVPASTMPLYNYMDIKFHEQSGPAVGDTVIRLRKLLGGVIHITIGSTAEVAVTDGADVEIVPDLDARQVGVYMQGVLVGVTTLPDSIINNGVHSFLYVSVNNTTVGSHSVRVNATDDRNWWNKIEDKRVYEYLT